MTGRYPTIIRRSLMKYIEYITAIIAGIVVTGISTYITYKQTKKLLTKINYRKSATGR